MNWPRVLECWHAVLDSSKDRAAAVRQISEVLLSSYGSSEELDLCIRALFSELCFSLADATPCYALLRRELPPREALSDFISWPLNMPLPLSQRTDACALVIADTMEMNPSLLSDNWCELLSFALPFGSGVYYAGCHRGLCCCCCCLCCFFNADCGR